MKRAGGQSGQKTPAKEALKKSEAEVVAATPLKRRPRLFVVLVIAFLIWLGVLLTLYFRTVYPIRHPARGVGVGAKS
jgi:hypothetical protein